MEERRLGSPTLLCWEHHSPPSISNGIFTSIWGIVDAVSVILKAEVVKKWAYLLYDYYSLNSDLKKHWWWRQDLEGTWLLELPHRRLLNRNRHCTAQRMRKKSHWGLSSYPIIGPTETIAVSSHIISQFSYISDECEAPGSR